MKATKYSLLICIQKLLEIHGSNYAYAGQVKYCELLKEKHGAKIGLRMLNYHLRDLESGGLIKRIKRSRRNEDGTLTLQTTAICITIAGCRYLALKGVNWAWAQLKKLAKKYVPATSFAGTKKTEKTTTEKNDGDDSTKNIGHEAWLEGISLYEKVLGLRTKNPRTGAG